MAIHIHIGKKARDKRTKDVEELYRGYKIKENPANHKFYVIDNPLKVVKLGLVTGFNSMEEAKRKIDSHLD